MGIHGGNLSILLAPAAVTAAAQISICALLLGTVHEKKASRPPVAWRILERQLRTVDRRCIWLEPSSQIQESGPQCIGLISNRGGSK